MECAETYGDNSAMTFLECFKDDCTPYSTKDCRFEELETHYVIYKGPHLIGYVAWTGAQDPDAYRIVALTLVILPEFRGQGLYRHCMRDLLSFLIAEHRKVWIITEIRNRSLKTICKSLGFEGVGIYQYYLWHTIEKEKARAFARHLIPLIDRRALK